MRLLLGISLLLLQSRPLVGTALCLHDSAQHRKQHAEHCSMPEHRVAPERVLSDTEPLQPCPIAQVCAVASPALVRLAEHLDVVLLQDALPPDLLHSLLPGDDPAPPSPPPIA